MPLVYLPDVAALFAWGAEADPNEFALSAHGTDSNAVLLTPEGLRSVNGKQLALLDGVTALALLPAAELGRVKSSVGSWALASKLALELVARERVVPTVSRRAGRVEARWAAALAAAEDAEKLALLAKSMSPAAHAVPQSRDPESEAWAPEALLRAFLDSTVDALVRSSVGAPAPPQRKDPARAWDRRWQIALQGAEAGFEVQGFAERGLLSELERWSEPVLGTRDRLRACFRLELPEGESTSFVLRFLLQSPDDPSLLVTAREVWSASGPGLAKLGREFNDPEEALLEALGRAVRVVPGLAPALNQPKPEQLELDPSAAWSFLGEGAARLAEAGFGVIVPSELTRAGQRRLRLRLRVGTSPKVAGKVNGAGALGMDELLTVDWQAVLGDHVLNARELSLLAQHKAPLVRYRGAWAAIDPGELADIQARLSQGPTKLSTREALRATLAGEAVWGDKTVAVSPGPTLQRVLDRLQGGKSSELRAPVDLNATLRHYQARGLAWLWTLSSLGLGACLADDMGLGKTVQLLAFLLVRARERPSCRKPTLIVAPTSVLGNWQRETARFAPSLRVVQHFGSERHRSAEAFTAEPGAVVLTSYGVLRRDQELLARVEWAVVVLDEAQNIKNSASGTARAARALAASDRIALTGTPVENRLAELWSILEFANPGLLGDLQAFRRDFAVPIERYGSEPAAKRLRKLVEPFILRRSKSDPAVISDLPAKNEAKMLCTLTREQASLYKAVVDEELRRIATSSGVERRGRVLALLTSTKQICNHPAQYLREAGPLSHRSGKLARISEMLAEAMAVGDRVLVFTQFREMGERLVAHFRATLDGQVSFLHGGTTKKARDELVQRFQESPESPHVFVLSLKAGGTGLNLTAANHVFHYDRWWNPAVEDQATDRAYRIGQKRSVQVHKLVCAGTVEDKIDRLLEQKRTLAAKVVGAGERWITELDDAGLRELFTLNAAAVDLQS